MAKIIIENRSDLNDYNSLAIVMHIVGNGRESNNGKQYCYLTVLGWYGKVYQVATDLNKKSDRFVINNQPVESEDQPKKIFQTSEEYYKINKK